MANYDESEYFVDSQEEIAEREAQEALRRVVRTEIRRVQTGAADADIAEDIAREEEMQAEEAKREKPLWRVKAERFLTGDILLAEAADKVYHLLVLLGFVFLVSIFTIFGAFQQDLRRNALQKEVALLKEQAIRMSEERMQHSSHSAILKKLQERGIEIEDPRIPPMVVK